jgi:hypothetical protein
MTPLRPKTRFRSAPGVLVPASLLPFKEEWQRIANALLEGDALLVVPDE